MDNSNMKDERIKTIEAKFKFDIAKLEADIRQIEADAKIVDSPTVPYIDMVDECIERLKFLQFSMEDGYHRFREEIRRLNRQHEAIMATREKEHLEEAREFTIKIHDLREQLDNIYIKYNL